MKFKKIYTLPVAIGAVLFFLSNAAGPGGQFSREVTGAPGSQGNEGTCGNTGCHASGAFDPSITIELLDGGSPVTEYLPGQAYTLKIVNTPGAGNPSRFGFQAVSLDAAIEQAGSWGDIGAGKQVVELSGRSYLEHNSPSSNGTFEMEWNAPDAGTGEVTFYAASNAADGNGGSTGDGTASSTLVVAESGGPNSTSDLGRQVASLEVLPNPVGETLTVEVTSRMSGNFDLRIVSVNGSIVQSENMNLSAGVNREMFDVGNLPSGLYILQLCGEEHVTATQLLKK